MQESIVLLIAQVMFLVSGLGLMIVVSRWIKSRPSNDPALDRLFFLTSPLLWFLRKNGRK